MKVVINFYDQAGKGKRKIKTNGKNGGSKKNKKAAKAVEVKHDWQPVYDVASIMGPFSMTNEMLSKYPELQDIIRAIESGCNDDSVNHGAEPEQHQCNCRNSDECVRKDDDHECECENSEKVPEEAALTDTGTGKYKTGDIVQFVYDGRTWDAIIVDANDEWAEVIFLDVLDEDRPMNTEDTNKGGFPASDLCKWLNSEAISKFPKLTQDQMVAYQDGIKLRIPTEKQIFGCNEYGEDKLDEKQFEPMKKRRNRIAMQKDDSSEYGYGEVLSWYWLEDKRKNSSARFCGCSNSGSAGYLHASYAGGVRLRFRIVNR